MRRKSIVWAFIAVNCVSRIFAVGSGGYENQVPGARAMGRANSMVASVDDATAVSFNPARLPFLKTGDVSAGVSLQNVRTNFTGANNVSDSSDNSLASTPNFHFGNKTKDSRFGYGLGINIPQGVSTNWRKESPLSTLATKSELAILDISPAVGYKISDQFAIGVGLDYYSISKLTSKKQLSTDSESSLTADGKKLGANIGLSYLPNEIHQLGLSYKSGANIKAKGDLELKNLTAIGLDSVFGADSYKIHAESKIIVPAVLQLGYAYKPIPNFIIELDAQWDRWSAFRDQNIKYSETDQNRLDVLNSGNPTIKDWKNAWSVGLGSEYNFQNDLSVRAGYAFFDSPIPNSTFEPSTPDSDIHMLSFGVGKKFKPVYFDFGVQIFRLNNRHINNSALSGTFKTNAEYYAFNIGYKFGAE